MVGHCQRAERLIEGDFGVVLSGNDTAMYPLFFFTVYDSRPSMTLHKRSGCD